MSRPEARSLGPGSQGASIVPAFQPRPPAAGESCSVSSAPTSSSHDAAGLEDGDAVAELDHLLGVGGDQKDRAALLAQVHPDALDLGPCPDVDPARRIDQKEHVGLGGEPARDLNLLLVAAAEACRPPHRSREP